MRVDGKEIPGAAVIAAMGAMSGRFTARSVETALRGAGCGDESYRAADRLIQRERKAGRIAVAERAGGSAYWERAK